MSAAAITFFHSCQVDELYGAAVWSIPNGPLSAARKSDAGQAKSNKRAEKNRFAHNVNLCSVRVAMRGCKRVGVIPSASPHRAFDLSQEIWLPHGGLG
jgi:hypothetical protein